MVTDTFGFYTRKSVRDHESAGAGCGWVRGAGDWRGGRGPGSGGSGGVALAEGGLDPVDDVVGGSARREDLGHAHPLQFGDVGVGDDAAAEHGDIRGAA